QRIADTVLRLVTDRVDLARMEAREEIDRALALGARLLLFGAACAVGLVMIALAATELLAPLMATRGLRLLVVGAPLCGAGAWGVLALAGSLRPAETLPCPPDLTDEIAPVDQGEQIDELDQKR